VTSLQTGEMWIPVNPEWRTENDLGAMAQGDRHFVVFQRADSMPGTTLRLRITCESDQGTWTIYREVKFTPPPFAIR
jgi:hypothetical protein